MELSFIPTLFHFGVENEVRSKKMEYLIELLYT